MAYDQPIIAFDNLLDTSLINIVHGSLAEGASLAALNNADLLRPCTFMPDSTGWVELHIHIGQTVDCLILGAARNDVSGKLTGVTSLTMQAFMATHPFGFSAFGVGNYGGYMQVAGTQVLPVDTLSANSALYKFPATAHFISVRLLGTVGVPMVIPELFLGRTLTMPYLDYGYDPYNEVAANTLFVAESGREYARLRYRRVELSPSWSMIETALWAAVDNFRKRALETRQAFWFAWAPDSARTQVYLVRHTGNGAPFPMHSAKHRSLKLTLQEVI